MLKPARAFALAFAFSLPLAACQNTQTESHPAAASEIAWRHGDVADALAEAREQNKPVILYWGAVWCPPCNQMKTTLFRDPGFIAKTRGFVPVYLDGDTKGAQQWGERFGVSGYPTVVVLSPRGEEITRIASATMANELPQLLTLAAARTVPIEQVLGKARNDPAQLSADDWRILAGFDWLNDPKHFADKVELPPLLRKLGDAAPTAALERRFALLALAAADPGDGKPLPAQDQARLAAVLTPLLADPNEVRANRQELIYYAPKPVAGLADAGRRAALSAALVEAGDALFADAKLSPTDRADAARIDLELAKAQGKVPADVLAKIRDRAKWADANAKDKMERQAVIDDAAYLLFDAGDHDGARRLAQAELKTSDQPYYYMSSLSDFAEQDGDHAGAVAWARKAYDAAQGPATRVQWAINWSLSIMRNTPDDTRAVKQSADAVMAERANAGDYYQRTRVKSEKWVATLREWAAKHDGGAVLAGVLGKLDKGPAKAA